MERDQAPHGVKEVRKVGSKRRGAEGRLKGRSEEEEHRRREREEERA